MKNKKIFLWFILVLCFIILFGACQMNPYQKELLEGVPKLDTKENGGDMPLNITISPKIYEEFNMSFEVSIYVELHSSNQTNIQALVSEVLASIPNFELRSRYSKFPGFSGNITFVDFNVLSRDPRVKMIILDKTYLLKENGDDVLLNISIDPRIYGEFVNRTEVPVYVELYESNETDIQTLENRILSTIPRFKLLYKYQSFPGFAGNVTISDFNILSKDPRVKKIRLDKGKTHLA